MTAGNGPAATKRDLRRKSRHQVLEPNTLDEGERADISKTEEGKLDSVVFTLSSRLDTGRSRRRPKVLRQGLLITRRRLVSGVAQLRKKPDGGLVGECSYCVTRRQVLRAAASEVIKQVARGSVDERRGRRAELGYFKATQANNAVRVRIVNRLEKAGVCCGAHQARWGHQHRGRMPVAVAATH